MAQCVGKKHGPGRSVRSMAGGVVRLLTCMLSGVSLAVLTLMACVNAEFLLSMMRGGRPGIPEQLAYVGLLTGSVGVTLWLLLRSAELMPPRWLLAPAIMLAAACGAAMCLMNASKALRLPGLLISLQLGGHGGYLLLERDGSQRQG